MSYNIFAMNQQTARDYPEKVGLAIGVVQDHVLEHGTAAAHLLQQYEGLFTELKEDRYVVELKINDDIIHQEQMVQLCWLIAKKLPKGSSLSVRAVLEQALAACTERRLGSVFHLVARDPKNYEKQVFSTTGQYCRADAFAAVGDFIAGCVVGVAGESLEEEGRSKKRMNAGRTRQRRWRRKRPAIFITSAVACDTPSSSNQRAIHFDLVSNDFV